jgi:hypothetical protein
MPRQHCGLVPEVSRFSEVVVDGDFRGQDVDCEDCWF